MKLAISLLCIWCLAAAPADPAALEVPKAPADIKTAPDPAERTDAPAGAQAKAASSTDPSPSPRDALEAEPRTGQASQASRRYVAVHILNVRAAPGGEVIGQLYFNEEVRVLSEEDGWARIDHGRGRPAFVASRALKKRRSEPRMNEDARWNWYSAHAISGIDLGFRWPYPATPALYGDRGPERSFDYYFSGNVQVNRENESKAQYRFLDPIVRGIAKKLSASSTFFARNPEFAGLVVPVSDIADERSAKKGARYDKRAAVALAGARLPTLLSWLRTGGSATRTTLEPFRHKGEYLIGFDVRLSGELPSAVLLGLEQEAREVPITSFFYDDTSCDFTRYGVRLETPPKVRSRGDQGSVFMLLLPPGGFDWKAVRVSRLNPKRLFNTKAPGAVASFLERLVVTQIDLDGDGTAELVYVIDPAPASAPYNLVLGFVSQGGAWRLFDMLNGYLDETGC